MNVAIAITLVVLFALLILSSYVERLYAEIGKFLSREFQNNIDNFEKLVEPKLKVGGNAAVAGDEAICALSATAPANPFEGVRVMVEELPLAAPAETVTFVAVMLKPGGAGSTTSDAVLVPGTKFESPL